MSTKFSKSYSKQRAAVTSKQRAAVTKSNPYTALVPMNISGIFLQFLVGAHKVLEMAIELRPHNVICNP